MAADLYNVGLRVLEEKGLILPEKNYQQVVSLADELEAEINKPGFRSKYSYDDRFAIERQYEQLRNLIRNQNLYLDVYNEMADQILAGLTEENLKEAELTEYIVYNNFLRVLSKIRDDLEAKLEASRQRARDSGWRV